MSTTLIEQCLRRRNRPQSEPLKFRATITFDIEVDDDRDAMKQKAAIEAAFALIRPLHEAASLDFKQRRIRTRPRPGAPAHIVAVYADD